MSQAFNIARARPQYLRILPSSPPKASKALTCRMASKNVLGGPTLSASLRSLSGIGVALVTPTPAAPAPMAAPPLPHGLAADLGPPGTREGMNAEHPVSSVAATPRQRRVPTPGWPFALVILSPCEIPSTHTLRTSE
jgi:hypothetical protein